MRFAGTWRKRWRYVGAFGERVMLCAASVRIGPLGQTFWAVLDRESGEVIENTKQLLPGAARRGLDRARRRPRRLGARLGRRRPADEDRRPRGDREALVRRLRRLGRVGLSRTATAATSGPASGPRGSTSTSTSASAGRIRETLRGIEDESAGYHPRHTVWNWSAGVGTGADGRDVAWNLVEGVNDPASGSERAIWVEGEEVAREPGPVNFDGLDAVELRRRLPPRIRRRRRAPRRGEPRSSSSTATASRSAASAARSTASTWPRESASWSTRTPSGDNPKRRATWTSSRSSRRKR